MRDPYNLEQVCALDPEFVGFIFFPGSKRFVGTRPDPALFDIPGPSIRKVGVFVDEDLAQVRKAVEQFNLDVVQLHGTESADYCGQFSRNGIDVIKVIDPHGPEMDLEGYLEEVDYLLFDSAGAGSGGSGQKFDWGLLTELSTPFPFFLSGGIGREDAGQIRSLDLKGLRGVDINSRFEISPGLKDVEQLREFSIEIRK